MTSIFVFIAFLSVLIFVHELGHFLAAKACGIYVDQFSIGMPPRVFGFKYGETDYCIGLLPIGGYVKMAGQEDVPKSDEDREQTYGHVPPERWFNRRPLWQRAIVLVAGPLMNFILGFIVFAGLAATGSEIPFFEIDNRIGVVEEDSPASKALLYAVSPGGGPVDFSGEPDATGWQTGDRLISMNGDEIGGFQDIRVKGALNKGKIIVTELERLEPDGTATRYMSRVEPLALDDSGIPRFGIAPFHTALIGRVLGATPAERAGLQEGDEIVRANGALVDSGSFSEMVRKLSPESSIQLEVERDGQTILTTLQTQGRGRIEGVFFMPPLYPFVATREGLSVRIRREDSAWTKITGLIEGDLIEKIDGEEASWDTIRRLSDGDGEEEVEVAILRPEKLWGALGKEARYTLTVSVKQLLDGIVGLSLDQSPEIVSISEEAGLAFGLQRKDFIIEVDGEPATSALLRQISEERIGEEVAVKVRRPTIGFGLIQRESIEEGTLKATVVQQIGVAWGMKTVFRRSAPSEVIPRAWSQCVGVTMEVGAVLSRLVTGGLSLKLIGGPVMIYDLTTQAAQMGLVKYLEIMALISINLCLFNLLPLPVLDGGQLVFVAIEGIRRKPVDIKILETVQQVGLLLILALIVYVTFNDVSRLVFNMKP